MPVRVACVVLNWRGWRDTVRCLDSLWPAVQSGAAALVVCDNGSGDESWAQLQAWAQQHWAAAELSLLTQPDLAATATPFTLMQTGANLGFAGGMNVGLRHALRVLQPDYLWLLNNDVEVAPDALSALLACADADPRLALLGSTVLDAQQRDRVQCAGGCRYYPLLTVFRPVWAGHTLSAVLAQPHPPRLDYVYGAALFLRASAVRQVGELNEEYFLFYEELDYCQRLKQADYQIAWCREALVYHQGSASIGRPGQAARERIVFANYYENLSTLKYSRRFYPRRFWLIFMLRFSLKSLALLLTGRFYLFAPLWAAYRDFLSGDTTPRTRETSSEP